MIQKEAAAVSVTLEAGDIMNLRKIILALGVLLIIGGLGTIGWFFAQNRISEVKMKTYADDFMSSLNENDPVVAEEKILVGDTTGVLEFPAFDNERIAIKEGTTNHILSIAAGHMKSTEQVFDKEGNAAIAAHNDTFFKNVKNFNKGDQIIVYTRHGVYEYEVYSIKSVDPTDLSVLEDFEGNKILTLITCNFSGSKRVVVQAMGGEKIEDPKDI